MRGASSNNGEAVTQGEGQIAGPAIFQTENGRIFA